MNTLHTLLDKSRVNLDPGDIEILLGMPEDSRDLYTRELIERLIEQSLDVFEPKGGYISIPAIENENKGNFRIDKEIFKTGKIISSRLQGAEEYNFFLGTAGPGPEMLSKSLLNKGDLLEGFIADLIASSLAEWVSRQIHDMIIDEATKAGRGFSNRYSPGYCGWSVSEQQKLFRLFPDHYCGIELSESSLMSPIKSVSGVVATGSSVVFSDYVCEECNLNNCPYRKLQLFNHRAGIARKKKM